MLQANYFNGVITIWLDANIVMKAGKRAKMGAKGVLEAARAHGFQIVEDGDQYTISPELVTEPAPAVEPEPVVEPTPFEGMDAANQALFTQGITLLARFDADTAVAAACELDLDSLYDWLDRLAETVNNALRHDIVSWEMTVLADPVVEPAPEAPSLMTFPSDTLAMVETEAVDQAGDDEAAYIEYIGADLDDPWLEAVVWTCPNESQEACGRAAYLQALSDTAAYEAYAVAEHFVPIAPPKRMPMPPTSVIDTLVEVNVSGDVAHVLYFHSGEYGTKMVAQHKLPNRFWVALKDHGFAVYAPQGYGTCRAFHKARYDEYLASQVIAPPTPTIAVSPPPEGWVHVTSAGYWIALPGTKGQWHGFTKALRRKGYNMARVVKWLKEHGLRVTHRTKLDIKLVGDLSKITV